MIKFVSKSLIRVNGMSSKRGIAPVSSRIIGGPAVSSQRQQPRSHNNPSCQFLVRLYSGTVSRRAPSSNKTDNNENDDDFVLLYQRDSARNQLPQAAFGFSILNSTYWLWYTLDFIPAVNASPIGDLYINPMMGVGGIALGLLINLVTGVYPYSLVSKLGYTPKDQQVHVWKHELFPFITESTEAKQYSLGTIRLGSSSSDTQNLLQDSSAYSGHLGIQANEERFPMLMEVRKRYELKDAEVFLQIMLDPNAMEEMSHRSSSHYHRADRPKKRQPPKKQKQAATTGQAAESTKPVNIKRRHGKKNKKR